MRCIVKPLLLYVIFFGFILNVESQNSLNPSQVLLLNHLDRHQLWEDKILYLNQILQNNPNTDTLQLLLSESFYHLNQNDSAVSSLKKCNNAYLIKHHKYFLKLGLLLQKSDTTSVLQLINALLIHNSKFDNDAKILRSLIENKESGFQFSKDSLLQIFPFDIANHIINHQIILRKKTRTAVLLSMLAPGMGKVYLGRKKEGINMLALNIATGSMFFESLFKKGILNVYTIPSAALFSVFYLGNIYGTYKSVNKHKNDSYKELLFDLGIYYSSHK
jgi:TM2 domain-containing membrane protein YozV